MITKRSLVIAVLLAACLTALVFTAMPIAAVPEYDPWLDYNDDGDIDIKDIAAVCKIFGAVDGDPTKNVTVNGYYYDEHVIEMELVPDLYVIVLDEIVEGLRQVSISFLFLNAITANVYFFVYEGGNEACTFQETILLTGTSVFRTYDVMGSRIKVQLYNTGDIDRTVSMGYYATA